jgi:phospholipid N-methyltransferase
VREFARHPLTTASLLPSSGALARVMVPAASHPVARTARPVVVELGPGTGAFTAALQHPAGIRPDHHLALELNPVLGRSLAADHPQVEVVLGSAADLLAVLAEKDLLGRVDLVVSGLPWQAFAGPVGARLVPDIARALRPTGSYTQFTYSWTRWAPPGRRQLAAMRAAFGQVTVTGPVWRNLPPATVYTCRGPAAGARAA